MHCNALQYNVGCNNIYIFMFFLYLKNKKKKKDARYRSGDSAREVGLIHPDSFTWIYILFKIEHFGDISDFFQIFMFEEA